MKKVFLTFIAAGFGFSVAVAQVAPTPENQQDKEVQTEQSVASQEEENRRQVEMSELPQATQDAFKNGAYSDFQVLAIYETKPNAKEVSAMTEQTTLYEFELAQASAEKSADAGTVDDGLAGVEKEPVSARQPDVILHIDENGELVEEKKLDEEENKEEEQ